ncbi:cohesin domain-containing protein [Terracidiphilus sp.]|jgi:general secretion pathway protein D|uniref:cohesin domain-containing protein n=1 Tax=Terracidiphilus sp. TaxID=1964191 RepID=UPI003C1A99DC
MNRNWLFSPLRATFLLVFALTLAAGTSLYAQSAGKFYKRGQAAENTESWDVAYQAYQKAYQKNPKDLRYRTAMYRVRGAASGMHLTKGRQLEKAGEDQAAMVEFLRAADIDPSNEAATQEMEAVRERQKRAAAQAPPIPPVEVARQALFDSLGGPIELKPISTEPLTMRATEDTKNIYQAIGRAAGINVLFDQAYTSKRITVDLTNVSYLDALRIVGVQSNTFWRPVTPNTIFVAENTPAHRRDLDEQGVQTFYLTNAVQQSDLTDTLQTLRNVLGTDVKAFPVNSQNAIIVKGTPDQLLLAAKIISDIDKAMPEVVVDIAIMEVSKDWERTLGIAWPGNIGVQLQSPCTTSSTSSNCTSSTTSTTSSSTSSSNLTLYNLANLNSNDFAITMGAATANLLLSDANTKVLQSPRLRSTNMQKATTKIGERIPIATGTFSTGVASTLTAGVSQTQFTYIDIGVNVEMTPTIHNNGDVTLKIKIEDQSEGSNVTIDGVTEPIIIQKNSEQTVRLSEGEVSILGGILEQTDSTSWSGIPGLSAIPGLRYLFGSKDHTIMTDELVFMLVPHIVRGANYSASNLRMVDTGTGASIQLRRLPVDGPAASAAPVVQTGVATTFVSSFKAPSASAAAPMALADMRKSAEGALDAVQTQGPKSPASPPPMVPPSLPMTPAAAAQPAANPAPGSAVRFILSNPGPVTNGATFQVPVVISGAADIASVPLKLHYDATKLSLVGVAPGDFLNRDNQTVSPTFRDDPAGDITINASRPSSAPGVSGAGVVYVLNFQAKAPGDSTIAITQPVAMNKSQQSVPATGGGVNITVK